MNGENFITLGAGMPATTTRVVYYNPDMMDLMVDAVGHLAAGGYLEAVEKLGYLALMLDPHDPRSDLWTGLGLEASGNIEHAQLAFETAIAKDPLCQPAHLALGILFLKEGEYRKALEPLQIAMTMNPEQPRALQAFMLCLLSLGDLERGWRAYAKRNVFKAVDRIITKYPDSFRWWDGATKANVLMIAEEGFGERIMFASMLPDAIKHGATPVLEMIGEFGKFVPLFKRSFPDCIIGEENTNHSVSAKLNIGDLGGFYRRDFAAFPKHGGYLKADKKRTAKYRRRLSPGPIIGVSWKSEGPSGKEKSIALAQLMPLFRNFKCTFVDLQYGDTVKERESAPMLNHLPDVDLTDDIDGLASLVAACDLVVTISNVTAHLAGGLGVPVWMLAPRSRGLMWFWFSEREDSPWYPSMKIWRQTKDGWDPLLESVGHALTAREWPAWKDDNTA